MNNIIRDGQTRNGYIAAEPNHFGSLHFKYRPVLPALVDQVQREFDRLERSESAKAANANAHALIRGLIVQHIESWSEDAPIDGEHVGRLLYPVFNRLYTIITGLRASDPDPEANEEAETEEFADLLEAGGVETSVKNSPKA